MEGYEPAPSGYIPTFGGLVGANDLGTTLAHEHLFVLSSEIQSNFPSLWDANLGVRMAIEQLDQAYNAGVRTIVDMTVLGQGRDIELIRKVAEHVRVNIILATGIYSVDGIPLFARFRGPGSTIETEDPLLDLLMQDFIEGIGGTGIRPGLVKFACEQTPPGPAAGRMAAVVAEVHRRTHVPVVVHSDPFGGNGLALVRMLDREGVAPSSVVVAHAGDSPDLNYLRALADTGCMLGYDRYGMTPFAPDEQRNATLSSLIRAGHLAQLIISQDHPVHIDYLTQEQRERLYPEWSYIHLFEKVIPLLLKEEGVDEETVRILLEDNPRRMLTRMGKE